MSTLLLDGFEVDPAQWAQIETYEGTPLTGDVTWTKTLSAAGAGLPTSTVTVTGSTSHPTQGTHTWRFQGTPGASNYLAICPTASIDLSAYDAFIIVDTYTAAINGASSLVFFLTDGSSVVGATFGSVGATGAQVLAVLAANLATAYPFVIVNGTTGSTDYYLDNMWVNKGYYSSTLDWTSYNGYQKVTRTTSNATQGTYSWEISSDTTLGSAGIAQTNTVDVTGYTHIKVDLTAITTATDDYYELYVTDGSYILTADSSASFTGSTTLDVDLTAEPSFDKTIAQVYIICFQGGAGGPCLFRVDNLLADDGGGGGGGSAIKTWDGLADASVKSAGGLARASVKTKNGLA